MALRRPLGCLIWAALVLTACKGKGDSAKQAAGLDARCEQLAKACGDNDKHVAKLLEGCKQAAAKQVDKGCTATAISAYDCAQKELCGKTDKVWAIDDLRVLGERQHKCEAERTALRACTGE
jgi:hypothetical protein